MTRRDGTHDRVETRAEYLAFGDSHKRASNNDIPQESQAYKQHLFIYDVVNNVLPFRCIVGKYYSYIYMFFPCRSEIWPAFWLMACCYLEICDIFTIR